jgi:hypothetical protein
MLTSMLSTLRPFVEGTLLLHGQEFLHGMYVGIRLSTCIRRMIYVMQFS